MISIVIISKDEASLDSTLSDVADQAGELTEDHEIVVVDASEGRLDSIRQRHQARVRWIDFQPPAGVTVSIPHQRNVGVRAAAGEVIVFIDAGCEPEPGWLARLVAPFADGEAAAAGVARSAAGDAGVYDAWLPSSEAVRYVPESGAATLAFLKRAFEAVGGFDERFAYGSDIDFTWRLVDAGYRIRKVPDSVIRHDYGTWRRQLRRSYVYGKARARLYRKHRGRLRHVLATDPMVVAYPLFLLGLPLAVVFPPYLALLAVPAWRNRSQGLAKAGRVLVDHLMFGLGVLAELVT